ncbi:MAG: glycosyltransferase family 4 protein [Chitinispirillaceae bacterium]
MKPGPVLIINYEYPPVGAGAATAAFHLAGNLVGKVECVTVLTAAFGTNAGYSIENGVHVHRVKSPRKRADRSNMLEMALFVLMAVPKMFHIHRKFRISRSVVFFSLPCGPLGVLGKLLAGVPYIVSLRGGDVPGTEKKLDRIHRILKPLRHMVLRNSSHITAPSLGLKEMSESVDPFPVTTISNGIDCGYFEPGCMKKDNVFRYLFVGRFQKQKDISELIAAFRILSGKDHRRTELHLVGDGPMMDSVRDCMTEANLEKRVKFHGWMKKEEVRELLQTCDCFVNPSHYEGMPNAVLEAMACAMPVVASDVMGNRDIVYDGETGLLYTKGDVGMLAEKLEFVLIYPKAALLLGRNARKYVRQHHSWKAIALAYCRLLEKTK